MDFPQRLQNFLKNYEKETGYRYVIFGYECVNVKPLKKSKQKLQPSLFPIQEDTVFDESPIRKGVRREKKSKRFIKKCSKIREFTSNDTINQILY